MSEKPYLEAFFVCMPDAHGFSVYPISATVYRALEGVTAEVNVPCNRAEADYCLILMCLHKEVNELAIMEALSIQKDASTLVDQYRASFFDPSEVRE